MNFNGQYDMSHLFLVRLQAEEIREGSPPDGKLWCGRVQRVVSGEAYDFRGWAELIKQLGAMLGDAQAGTDIEA